jgi:hypothetical protein
MPANKLPPFCQTCLDQLRANCSHQHLSMQGNIHFSNGEVWDDLTETCDDCGAIMAQLPSLFSTILLDGNIPF